MSQSASGLPFAPAAQVPRAPVASGAAGLPWWVVVPVKGGSRAKTRLRAPEGVDHSHLATALALDTVSAAVGAVGAERVLVVTGDPGIAALVAARQVVVVEDPGGGLNPAIAAGLARARAVDPAGSVAVLLGDVPSARSEDLVVALHAAGRHDRSYLPDADDIGTVLLAAAAGARVEPRFGSGSAQVHAAAGAARLDLVLPRLRRDVDDEDSLREALCLGVGEHTARLLAHLVVPDRARHYASEQASSQVNEHVSEQAKDIGGDRVDARLRSRPA
ncbi:MAG: 2-phospho-L-lactate guanylyltransferase [Lapillicoccus sp.]